MNLMKYANGKEVHVGDNVRLWNGCRGVVVASIDTEEYSENYTKDEWAYLHAGILIDSDKAGLIHYLKPEKTFELLERKPA